MSPRLPLACATGPPVADPALARTNRTIAKSLVTLDIKPWDDETDMAALEAAVRSIEKPGLLWGLSKLVPIGFGIKKLQMSVVVEDELVSVDELQEEIAEFDDYVQVRPGVPFLRFFFFFSSSFSLSLFGFSSSLRVIGSVPARNLHAT